MSQGEELNLFLNKIVNVIGENNLLTSIEDLYVYSHVGEFGIKKIYNPLAVLRLGSASDTTKVIELAKKAELSLIWNDNRINNDNSTPCSTSILVDIRKSVSLEDLVEILSEKRLNVEKKKTEAKKNKSMLHRLTLSLQLMDGYRLIDNPNSDNGFCIVQPFFNGVETFTSKGRLLLAKGLAKGELDPSPRMVESIYNCTACGQCYDQLSDNSLEINNAIIKTRHELVKLGHSPKQCRRLVDNILKEKNPLGMSMEDRVLWYEETANKFNYEDNSVLYWPGCNTSYRLPEIVESTSKILGESSVDFGILGEKEGCCGLILYLYGHWDEAKKNAQNIVNGFGSNLTTLMTSCAGCYYAFSRVFPSLGIDMPFNVLHSSQFIKWAIKNRKIRVGANNGDFIWHDPCDLGRHCNVYEPPRFVLESIEDLNLVEYPLNRQHTTCCGAGGGLWLYNSELTESVSQQKILDTIPQNIDGIVTGCPACILSIQITARNLRPDLQVFDLSEIVTKCI